MPDALSAGCNYGFFNISTNGDADKADSTFRGKGYTGTCLHSPSTAQLSADLQNKNIIFLSGHGNNSCIWFRTGGWFESDVGFSVKFNNGNYVNMINYLSANVECVIYAGCKTAQRDDSITRKTVSQGLAQNAIGWKDSVCNGPHSWWLSRFFHSISLMPGNIDWQDAVDDANGGACFGYYTGVKSCVLIN